MSHISSSNHTPAVNGGELPHRTRPTHLFIARHGETSPQPWVRPKVADALLISLEDLDHLLVAEQPAEVVRTFAAADEAGDVVLTASWSHRGTVEAAVMLSGGGDSRVKRRVFLSLTGTALTAPAHQWLVHEPEPLVAGLTGRRVSAGLADRLPAMIAELRAMDDVAGGGSVLSLAQHEFGWVTGLLDQASYDEATGRKLLVSLAELGQLASWGAYDSGQPGLAQRYNVGLAGRTQCRRSSPGRTHPWFDGQAGRSSRMAC